MMRSSEGLENVAHSIFRVKAPYFFSSFELLFKIENE